MSKKSKGLFLDSTMPYGGGLYEDAKARLRYQTLMQDYQELQKEVDVMRSKLEAGKQRKIILAAEVRFLQRRREYFVKTNTLNSSQEETLAQLRNLPKQTKQMKKFSRKEASQHRLPPIPQPKPQKKHCISKEVVLHSASPASQHRRRKVLHGGKEATQHSPTLISDLNHKGSIDIGGKTLALSSTPVLHLNQKERLHVNDTALRNTIVAFDLNQDNDPSGKEASFPSRAPIFDLNEISTGDEDFQSNVDALKFEEVKKSLMRRPSDEFQNDLKFICRNAGEGPSSRVGKRKISWQDPVALRV